MDNAIESFKNAIQTHDIIINACIIADGKLHRCHIEGDRPGTMNGAYVLHLDGKPSGYFEHFRSGVRFTWTLSGKREPITYAMRQQINHAKQQRLQEQQHANNQAAEKAVRIWDMASILTRTQQHLYLIKKHVQPFVLRLNSNTLIVPIYDTNEELVNLQFIDTDGNKRFLSGGKKKGCFSVIGNPKEDEKILICEGWATGASLHEHLNKPVIVAMDAGNLEPVARAIRSLYAKAEIIIMGDNDLSGKGQSEAKKAALVVKGKYLIPAIPGHDWNDMLTMEVV